MEWHRISLLLLRMRVLLAKRTICRERGETDRSVCPALLLAPMSLLRALVGAVDFAGRRLRCCCLGPNMFDETLIYESSNGDCWYLARDAHPERMVVRHQPNRASGRRQSFYDIEVFFWPRGQARTRGAPAPVNLLGIYRWLMERENLTAGTPGIAVVPGVHSNEGRR